MEGMVLKHSLAPFEELYLTTKPKESAADSRRLSHSLGLKDFDKLTRNIGKFNPSMPNSQNSQAYLQDIDFNLEIRPNVTDKDKVYLLRTTSSPEVRSFLDRQPANTKTDYQLLQKALIKEFADPESDQGLVAALETWKGRHEPPWAYYSRLRRADFGTRNKPDMEDELNFKTLFLRNLHPGISHHLDMCICWMSTVLRPNWLHCILCIILFYLTVLNFILNQFLYHFKIPCFIIFNSLFLLLWMIILLSFM